MSDSFRNLPPSLQNRIDDAFDLAAKSTSVPPLNAPATSSTPVLAGGFIIDEPPYDNELEATPCLPSYITLSSVVKALSYLDLPPDDEQILAAFRNAASGWSSAPNRLDEQSVSVGLVNRDDWRAVCAVLLDSQYEESEDNETNSVSSAIIDGSDSEDQDNFSLYEDSGDDYQVPSSKMRHRQTTSRCSQNTSEQHSLTKKQKDACIEAFSLFFPTVPSADLPEQKILMKDIQQAAKSLGEKLTTDEIIEMLEMFSSSPGKSVNLSDFSQIMVAAKLV